MTLTQTCSTICVLNRTTFPPLVCSAFASLMLTLFVLTSLRKKKYFQYLAKKNTFNIWPLEEVVNIYGIIVYLYLFSNFTLLNRGSNKGRRRQKQTLSLLVSTFLPNTAFQYSNIRPTVAAADRQLRVTSSFFFFSLLSKLF